LGDATEPESRSSRPDDRGFELAFRHHLVEGQAQPVTVAEADPADARGQALELDAAGETRVLVALDAGAIACGTQCTALAPREARVLGGREPSVLDQPSLAQVAAIAFHDEDRAK
jgi:hypothetical protein